MEQQKELRILQECFGGNINIDWRKKDTIKDFINTFNKCLQSQPIYERNLAIIKEGKRYNNEHYAINQVYNYIKFDYSIVKEKIANAYVNSNSQANFLDNCDKILTNYLNDALLQAINEALSNNEFHIDQKYKNAYETLLKIINDIGSGNVLSQQLYQTYHLENIKQQIMEKLKGVNNEKDINKALNKQKLGVKNQIIKHATSKTARGQSYEALRQTILTYISSIAQGKKSVGFMSGPKLIKSDNTFVYGVDDPSIFDPLINSSGPTGRETFIKDAEIFGKQLSKFKDSLVTYSSAKLYETLIDNLSDPSKKFKGYSAGSDISLQTFANIMDQRVDTNIKTFVGTIMQTIPGAIGSSLKPSLEKAIAYDFAYLLFDDFQTIGFDSGDGASIHLLDLNGVFIPLSVLMRVFAGSMQQFVDNPTRLINITIQTPEGIKFKTAKEESAWRKQESEPPWRAQKNEALKEIKIGMTFLQDFKEFLLGMGII